VRPGEGGRDAESFSCELAGAIAAYARRRDEPVERLLSSGDARTIVLRVDGDRSVYWPLAGVHRVQRIPQSDSRGRRHTSTATIAVLDDRAPVVVQLCDEDLELAVYRGSGPGGQHRNKTATGVRLRHCPSGLVVNAEDSRSQWQNLTSAKEKLVRALTAAAEAEADSRIGGDRRFQIASVERSAKSFTHNDQRSEVLCHETGAVWRLQDWRRGRLERHKQL
jgi:peptide chain release factor 1